MPRGVGDGVDTTFVLHSKIVRIVAPVKHIPRPLSEEVMFLRVLALAILAVFVCPTLARPSPWTEDKALRDATVRGAVPKTIPHYTLNLDLPPQDRWTHIASLPQYANAAEEIQAYLSSQVPKWLVPLIKTIGKDVVPYFGSELGLEMQGLAKALKMDVGNLVAINLIMQLEHIGVNCSDWNNTGPTRPNDPGCVDVDPQQEWCYCHKKANVHRLFSTSVLKEAYGAAVEGPGMCTSVVVENPEGAIYHGRNLDWNIPVVLRKMVCDVDYQRGNATVFTGTTVVGFVGVVNGMKKGVFSASIDARGKGGKILANLLQALLHKSKTPAQHLRAVLSDANADTFANAVKLLSTGHQIDMNYFIVGGTKTGEGAVISRDRNKAADVWYMNNSNPVNGWWRLETNYDHWDPVPKADDRRTPGNANVAKMGQAGIGTDGSGLFKGVMTLWPTFNHHTDYTGIFSAAHDVYTSTVWE